MGKSSSSARKKRSKLRSKSRARKRNKNKTRENKSKKARRRDDSVYYSGDSDSESLGSISSSSSEEDYRSRRSRSRKQKNLKGSRKRARRQSISYESNEDTSHAGREKGSRRENDYETRKRAHHKTKHARVSSKTSGLRSCSPCSSEDRGSHKNEFVRRRYKDERKEKKRRRLNEIKIRSKSNRSRSRSRSSCSQYNEVGDNQIEEEVVEGNNSRRLRSVITVPTEREEGRAFDHSEHKEQIVYCHEGYPFCRSNDSNDGCFLSPENSHFTCLTNVDDQQGEKSEISNLRTSVVIESGQNYNPSCDKVGENDAASERKNEICGPVGDQNGDDLETVLRQRALENLIKFRGCPQMNTDSNQNETSDMNMLSTPKAELIQNESLRKNDPKMVSTSQVSQQIRLPASRTDPPNINNGGKESGSAECGVYASLNANNPKESVCGAINYNSHKPKLVSSVWRRESSNTRMTPKQVSASQETCQTKLVTESNVNKTVAETDQAGKLQSGKNTGKKLMDTHDSASSEPVCCFSSTSGNVTSDKLQVETKEGTQFEQKTMSVMRGGEMVQVSYKVYIPKKAPALSRRQLKQ